MTVYADLVMALNFAVDCLLLMAANRITGYPANLGRCAAAAALGSIYAGICLIWPLRGWQEGMMHLVCLGGMAWIAYGIRRSALRRSAVFLLLSMALGGVAQVLELGSLAGLVMGAGAIGGMAALGLLRQKSGMILPVELRHKGKLLRLDALQDTGNCLRDPVTGQSVLIIGARSARELTGLSLEQLRDPVQTMGTIPGLRLIPYRTVGQGNGMLLALKLEDVKIGNERGSRLVAFAAEEFAEGTYQALTGGVI